MLEAFAYKLQELDNNIAEVEKLKERGHSKIRVSFFSSQFNHLLKLRDMQAVTSHQPLILDANDAKSAHFAVRPTSSLVWYLDRGSGIRFAFPPILQDIWMYPQNIESTDRPRQFISGIFGFELLKIQETVIQGTIEQIPALQSETHALGRQLISQNRYISQGRIIRLKLLLLLNLEEVVDTHKPLYQFIDFNRIKDIMRRLRQALRDDCLLSDVKDIESLITSSSSTQVNDTIKQYLLPAIRLLHFTINAPLEQALHATGEAWIHYARGCLVLYVPNCPLDPAMKSIIKRERFLRREAELKDKIVAHKLFELHFTGQNANPMIEHLAAQVVDLGQEPPNSSIARPVESQMNHIQGEFSILLRTLVTGNSQDRLLAAIRECRSGYQEEEQLFQKNIEQMIERLQNNYPFYKDIIDPLVGFLYSLKLGYSLASMDIGDVKATESPLLTPADILTWPLQQLDSHDKSPSNEYLLHYLWSLATQSQVEGPAELNRDRIAAINNIFHTLYRNWKIKSIKEQEEARANASTYRYRGAEEGDDNIEIKEMFPDYVEQEINGEGEKEAVKPTKESHSELAVEIAQCHAAMFTPEVGASLEVKRIVLRGVSLCVKLLKKGAEGCFLSSKELEQLIAAQILTLKDADSWLSGHKPAAKRYDFYKDENLEQAQKLVAILDKLYYKILQLVETWPENVTLQDALDACRQVASLPNTTPVAKFLSHVEKLHGVLHEWQGVASKEYSLAEHFDALAQLTISWRRLELQAWPRLFDLEDEKCQFEASSWWIFLYESIIANPEQLVQSGENLDSHIADLTAVLCSFVQNSTIGQFENRLQLLRIFKDHADRFMDGQERLAGAMSNLISYFTEYTSVFTERIAIARKKAEKDVAEVILLASWKDTNIVALRESARRSHYKLYKIVKRYRQSLAEPALPVLAGRMPEGALNNLEPNSAPVTNVTILPQFDVAQSICSTVIGNWDNRPKRLVDVSDTIKLMQRISVLPSTLPDATDIVDSFASNAASTIKEFQTSTPAVLTEENKEEVKHLKNRKRVAYTDALRALRLMGLKSNLSSALLGKQLSLEKIFASARPLDSNVIGTVAASKYFYRALEGLPGVRRTAQDHSTELSGTEVMKSIGYIEHLVHLSIQQRDEISRSSMGLMLFKGIADTYKVVSSCLPDSADVMLHGKEGKDEVKYKLVKRVFRWLPKILDYVMEVLRAHSSFLGAQMAEETALFTEWRGMAWDIDRQFSANRPLYNGVWDNTTERLMKTAIASVDSITNDMLAVEVNYPDIKYLTQQVLPWLATVPETVHESRNAQNGISTGAPTLQDVDTSLQSLCNSMLVSLQQLNQSYSLFPTADDEQGWLLRYQNAAISSIKSLHIGDITRKLQGILSLLGTLQPYTEQTSRVVRAIFAAYSPIIEQYQAITHEVISRLTALHRATAKMTYILGNAAATIVSKGFCTPQEKSDEKGDSSAVEQGTGLGDGEGMEDISKDVGADEDLSEVAQEKNKEEGDKAIEDEKDAVDIEDEMEGKMGDVKEKEDGEEQDGDEKEDEENEMDEETGEVDELDPTAVDEKLWDEKGNEDSREQLGDTKGNKPQNDMEAKKENGKEQKGEESKEEEMEGKEAEEEEVEALADEHDEVKKDDAGVADQHVPEVDTLDLPEDMNLDQDDKEDQGMDEDGMDMDDLSDIADDDKPMEDYEADPESFPDVDGEEKPGDENKPTEEEKMGGEESQGEEGEDDSGEVTDEQDATGEDMDQSEDNILQNKSEESNTAQDTAPSEVQGVEGGSEQQQDNEAASARQEMGEENSKQSNQGQGNNEAQSDEEATGQQSAIPNESRPKDQATAEKEQSVERSSFKKAGDILERWHRQQKEILGAQEKEHERVDEMVSFCYPEQLLCLFTYFPNRIPTTLNLSTSLMKMPLLILKHWVLLQKNKPTPSTT